MPVTSGACGRGASGLAPCRRPPPPRPRNARPSASAASAISHGASQTPFTASRHQADAPIASRLTAGASASRTVHHDRRQGSSRCGTSSSQRAGTGCSQMRTPARADCTTRAPRARPPARQPRHNPGSRLATPRPISHGQPITRPKAANQSGSSAGPRPHALERVRDAEDAAPHPLEGRRIQLVRGVGRLVVVGIEGDEGRVRGEESRVARLQEGQVVAVEPHAERPHRRLVEPRQPGVADPERSARLARALEGRAHEPRRGDHRAALLARVRVGDRVEDGRPASPARHLDGERGGHRPGPRPEALDEGPGARGRALPRRPGLLPVERDEHDRPRPPLVARQHAAELDQDPDSPAVVVGAGRLGSGVVVGADHHEVVAGRPERRDHVGAADAVPLERLQLDLVEPGPAQLRRHVRGRRLVAGRAPRVRAEGGQGRGVAEGGFAVDRGGEQEAEERGHSGRDYSARDRTVAALAPGRHLARLSPSPEGLSKMRVGWKSARRPVSRGDGARHRRHGAGAGRGDREGREEGVRPGRRGRLGRGAEGEAPPVERDDHDEGQDLRAPRGGRPGGRDASSSRTRTRSSTTCSRCPARTGSTSTSTRSRRAGPGSSGTPAWCACTATSTRR